MPHVAEEKVKMSFSDERNQKTFMSSAALTYPARSWISTLAQNVKVFWFFSSEKNIFSLLPWFAASACDDGLAL
jgi:hypothetical protein